MGAPPWNDRFSGKDMENIQYIKVVTTKNASVYGIKLHDLKMYGKSAVKSIATSIEAAAAETLVNVDAEVALSAEVKDQFGDAMDVNVEFSCEDENATITDGVFKASQVGEYTIVAKYEELTAEVKITVKKNLMKFYNLAGTKYGTMIIPFEAEVPAGYEVYSVAGTTDSQFGYTVLQLTKEEKVEAYKPYIIYWDGNLDVADGTCLFSGDITTETDANVYENGWLRGVLMNGNAPADSYVLTTKDEKLGFYKAAEDATVEAYHAYLAPESAEGVTAFVFDLDGVTAIESIATSEALVNVYDLNGTLVRKNVKAANALQGLQKGTYVVNGAKKAAK